MSIQNSHQEFHTTTSGGYLSDGGEKNAIQYPLNPPEATMFMPLRSLRTRLLLPILAASLLVALAVTLISYTLGSQWAEQDVTKRADGVQQVLQSATFPLTDNVLRLIASLTRTDVAVFSQQGDLLAGTFDIRKLEPHVQVLLNRPNDSSRKSIFNGQRSCLAFVTDRTFVRGDSQVSEKILILVDESEVRAARWRAAALPLITGLSTTLLLGTLTLVLTGRLISRLSRLKSNVQRVAAGDFSATVSDNTPDEVGNLGEAVDSMATQLNGLWQAVNRRQGERLLHQLSAGLAHELRNSLTGARMALELHARNCPQREDASLGVANVVLGDMDDYVRRLVLVGHGQIDRDKPSRVDHCLSRVQSRVSPFAEHQHVEIAWRIGDSFSKLTVSDGQMFEAAITNLVMNSVQAAKKVEVHVRLDSDDFLEVRVIDTGPGIPAEIADTLFEPLVTTKPEGMGIGLAHVQRTAEHLGGDVTWRRQDGQTIFELRVRVEKTSS